MTSSRWRAVLFDFDYTLVDSSPGIIRCVNDALAKLRLPLASPEQVRPTIGLTLEETFTRLTGSSEAGLQREFSRLFVACADEVMVASTTLFPAARTVIPQLRQGGYLLAVVSTKYHDRLQGVLEREGLLEHFAVLVGGDEVARQKPAPDSLLYAANVLHLAPGECLYVGDTPVDHAAAAAAGMDFVGILSGVQPRAAFAPGATLLATLEDLPAWLHTNDL